MAFRVTDLMSVVDPSTPIPMHLTCGPLSVDTQYPTASANQPRTGRQFDCGLTAEPTLRLQLAEMQECGEVSLTEILAGAEMLLRPGDPFPHSYPSDERYSLGR